MAVEARTTSPLSYDAPENCALAATPPVLSCCTSMAMSEPILVASVVLPTP
jgi:hypothetical protein